jgi:hypothetical protein
MNGFYEPADKYEDVDPRTQGFTEATLALTEAWEDTKRTYKNDPAKVFAAMDIFFLGVQVRLTGGSMASVMETLANSLTASDVLNDRR